MSVQKGSKSVFSLISLLIEKNMLQQVISIAFSILYIIGQYRVFQKAGVPGWKALIPYHHLKVEAQIAEKEELFKWEIITCLGIYFFLAVAVYYGEDNLFALVFGIAMTIVFWVLSMIVNWKIRYALCTLFGKSKNFAVGMLLFSEVFMLILGFDDSKYHEEVRS